MERLSICTFSRTSLCLLIIVVHKLIPSEQFIYKRNGHYRITKFPKNDESYLQTKNINDLVMSFVETGIESLFKEAPVWGREDPKYLDQIKFNCYMYKGEAADKTTQETSHSIKKDFMFTSRDLRENLESLKSSFAGRKNHRFGFLIHGAATGHKLYDIHLKPFMDVIATDLRSKLHMNVIVMDWTELAVWNYFIVSKENTLYVAEAIRTAIRAIASVMEMSEEEEMDYLLQIMLIGHSLGAHVAGMVGHLLTKPATERENPGMKMLGTIVGLDPVGIGIPPYGTTRHCLTHKDARRVIILHTSTILVGSSYRTGHEDWYVHGGAEIVPSSLSLSHMRATNLFRELIWYQAIGYALKLPNHIYRNDDMSDPSLIRRINFDLATIPVNESEIVPYPIYLPANLRYPYFDNNQTPKRIPAYSRSKKNGWEKIYFDFRYKFIQSIQLDEWA